MNWTVDAPTWGDVAAITAGLVLYQICAAVVRKLWKRKR